jgi:hypothetical protein
LEEFRKEIGEWFKGDLRETPRGGWEGIRMGFKRDLAEGTCYRFMHFDIKP